MLLWASTILAVGFAFLCEHPEKIAAWGLSAQLHRKALLTWLLRQAYRSLFGVYTLVHGEAPGTAVDRVVQFEWFSQLRDAAVLKRVAEIVHDIEERQQTAIEWNSDTEPLFLELREKVLQNADADWHDLGFQGKNPATDFRGAGKLGLDNLYAFSTQETENCRRLLAESRSSTTEAAVQLWYPLALVSIRLSMAIGELLKRERLLIVHIVTSNRRTEWEALLRELHHRALSRFHAAWLASIADGTIKSYFDNEIVLKEFEAGLPELVYSLIREATATDRPASLPQGGPVMRPH